MGHSGSLSMKLSCTLGTVTDRQLASLVARQLHGDLQIRTPHATCLVSSVMRQQACPAQASSTAPRRIRPDPLAGVTSQVAVRRARTGATGNW